jgi:ribosomal protein S18 acetylase RimI-like enzyme
VIGEGTKHASWHLQTLAVDPAYQRQGAAKSLVQTVVEKAAPTNTRLVVECATKTNVSPSFLFI